MWVQIMRSPIRANFPEERECGMVVELNGSTTGSQQLSWDEWPFCDEFTIIKALSSSTNKLLLEDLQWAQNYRDFFGYTYKTKPVSWNETREQWFGFSESSHQNSILCSYFCFLSFHPCMYPPWVGMEPTVGGCFLSHVWVFWVAFSPPRFIFLFLIGSLA